MKFKRKRKPRQLALLGAIRNDADLAAVLSVPKDDLVNVTKNAQRMYLRIPYKKKDGTMRAIRAPKDDLKRIQRAILDVILMRVRLPKCAYGFSAGRSIIENASLHAKEPYVLNIDIKDFFPSVHHIRVEKLFQELGAVPEVAKMLTKLTILEYALPQGAPSSPYIATLALDELDRRITMLCGENRLTYSRYFDDITISGGPRSHHLKDRVIEIISSCGFEAHTRVDKLRLYGPGETRHITGIEITDGKLSVPIDNLSKYLEELKIHGMKMLHTDNPIKERLSLQGKIAFVAQVDSNLGLRLKTEFNQITWQ